MNKEKQIEELGKEIYEHCSAGLFEDEANAIAEFVINKQGYRKSTEVAREIFEEIAKIIQHHDELAQRDGSEYGELIVMDIGCAIAELKKKYMEEKDVSH